MKKTLRLNSILQLKKAEAIFFKVNPAYNILYK